MESYTLLYLMSESCMEERHGSQLMTKSCQIQKLSNQLARYIGKTNLIFKSHLGSQTVVPDTINRWPGFNALLL